MSLPALSPAYPQASPPTIPQAIPLGAPHLPHEQHVAPEPAPAPAPAPALHAHLRLVEHTPDLRSEPTHDAGHVHAAGLPPLTHKLIGKLAVFAYEIVEGSRTIGQLSNWVSTNVARQLAEYRSLTAERRSLYRDIRRVVPTVRCVRVTQPLPATAEAAVVLHTGSRVKAVALRFEGVRGRWQATSITVL